MPRRSTPMLQDFGTMPLVCEFAVLVASFTDEDCFQLSKRS